MTSLARHHVAASAPRAAEAHLFRGDGGGHLFLVDGSQLFDLAPASYARFEAAVAMGGLGDLLAENGLSGPPRIAEAPPEPPPLHALSLAISQRCNLGCGYCYAEQGGFGAPPRAMAEETALRAVDLLVDQAAPGSRVNLAFLGGEPLTNRPAFRAATRHAAASAARRGVGIGFSITTNGTLLTEEDADFFEEHGFAVTVSLDGEREAHDGLRPFRNGRGSYDAILRRLGPLLARGGRAQVSARVTVTPRNLDLLATLDAFVALGFHSVGFSPLLAAPNGRDEMRGEDLEAMLGAMIECAEEFERRSVAGERYPFANALQALREIGRGTHRPYPCGAGAGYLGVSAEGDLAACHRFVGDPEGAMGSLGTGPNPARRAAWLGERHVHRQEPCGACWARYLCGGGCHHEVLRRGRPACDYVRGWLSYCLGLYLRLPSDTLLRLTG